MVVAVLFNAGDQLPVILLLDVVGNAVKASPEHMGDTAVKAGVVLGFTVMVNVVVLAHCPAVGVNVYVVVAVLFNAGDQVPVIPLLEVVGNAANASPEQMGDTAVNVGSVLGSTVMVYVTAVPVHPLSVGVTEIVAVIVVAPAFVAVNDE